jgi:hypothetical protein
MAQPTREEIADIRKGASRPPDAATQFATLLNSAQGAEAEQAAETPTTPATPSEGPFAGKVLDSMTGAVLGADKKEPEVNPESKIAPYIRELKDELYGVKGELAAAKKELEEAKKTGTPDEQAIAREEYERLKLEAENAKTKALTYEQQIEQERNRGKELEGKLAQLSLDFDPDFQEKYIKPFETSQSQLYEMVDGLADNPQVADRIKGTILSALGAPNAQQFYSILKQVKEEDPDNYALYLPEVNKMRHLLVDRLTAMQNHDQTLQKLKTESYSTRERTVPEAMKALLLARQEIALKEPDLERHLQSPEHANYMKMQGIDVGRIESELHESIRKSHLQGQLDPKLLEFAAQGARKLQVQPFIEYANKRAQELEVENKQLRDQLDSLRGSTTPRGHTGAPGGDQRQVMTPPSREEIRRMSGEERQRRMMANLPS